jgi:two-component system cell cycle sensor histidine kinase/response regulator CckA
MNDNLRGHKSIRILRNLVINFTIAIFVLASISNAFEALVEWSQKHEEWQINKLIIGLIVLIFALSIFSIRRWRGLRYKITEPKQAEGGLKEIESRYKSLFDRTLFCVFVHDFEGKFLDANEAALKLLGHKKEEISSLDFYSLLEEDQLPIAFKTMEEIKQTGLQKNYNEFKVRKKDGDYVMVEVESSLIYRGGKPYAIQGIARDITERKQVETALQESEEKFRLTFENANIGVCLVDLEGNLTRVNNKMCEIFGYTKKELEGMTVNSIAHPEDIDKSPAFIQRTLRGETNQGTFEKRYFHKKGHVVTCQVSSSLVRDAKGSPLYFIFHVHDITKRKQAEEAILKSQQMLEKTFASLRVAVFIIDAKTVKILDCNPAASEIFGYSREEMIGRTTTFLHIDEAALDEFRKHLYTAIKEKGFLFLPEFMMKRKDGTCFNTEHNVTPLEDQQGNLVGWVSIVCDITERKQIEEALRKSEEVAKRLAKENAIVAEIGRIISSTLNINEVYKQFSEEVYKIITFDWIAISMIDHEKGTFQNEYNLGKDVPGRGIGIVIPLAGSLNEEVMRKRSVQLLHIEDRNELAGWLPLLLPFFDVGFRSFMSVPLISKDQVIGVLHLFSIKSKAYTEADKNLVESIGNQIAGAVANAQLLAERKRAEEKYRTIVRTAMDSFWIVDMQGRFLDVNDAYCRLIGYTRDELLTMTISDVEAEERPEETAQRIQKIMKVGEDRFETRHKCKDGRIINIEVSVNYMGINGGRFFVFLRDITGRKRAEEALRKSEEETKRLAQENAIMAEIGRIISSTLNIGEVYERFAEEVRKLIPFDRIMINLIDLKNNTSTPAYIAGIDVPGRRAGDITPLAGTVTEEVARTRSSLFIQIDNEDIDEVISRFPPLLPTFQAGLRSMIFVPLISKDQVIGVLSLRATKSNAYTERDIRLVERVSNQIAGAIANAQLFTERKEAEEALRTEKQRFQTLSENSPFGMIMADQTGTFKYINPKFKELLGYDLNDIPDGRTWFRKAFPDPTYRHHVISTWINDHRLENPKPGEKMKRTFTVTCKDGTEKIFDLLPVKLETGEYLTSFVDITQRKQADEALRQSEKRFKELFDDAPVGYVEYDSQGYITSVNRTELEMLGYTVDEMIGQSVWKFMVEEEIARQQIFAKLAGTMPPGRGLKRIYRRKDGTTFTVLFEDRLIRDEKGAIKGIRATIQDITELKQAEDRLATLQEQLRQSQKMEAIGQLAGGIAHDFNNLMTVIKGYSQLSLLDLKESDPMWGNIQEIQNATQRATDLTRQLLAFSRRQILDLKVLNMNTLIENLNKMLHRILGEDIELVTLLAEDLGRLKIDPGQIEQVIMNLAVNSRDAMPNGGKLTIETTNIELDEAYTRTHIAVIPGAYVMLSVSDTGCGMTREVRDRIFEPFFTTKEKGKGTGLGLSMVYGIVKQSGGNIFVYSEPGLGTTFKIYLPRVEGAEEWVKPSTIQAESSKGTETILLVEDEEAVRTLARTILERYGYKVLDAANGDEALRIAQEFDGNMIHLMLTDVVMPGMSGRELTDRLISLHPKMKVIYMSGYTDNAIVNHGVLEQRVNYIQKPFTSDTLAQKVRDVLDR